MYPSFAAGRNATVRKRACVADSRCTLVHTRVSARMLHLSSVATATPRSTSPNRFHGDVFLFFNSRTNSSCLLITASLAAIVSFFAASAAFKDSASLLRVSFISFKRADDWFAVSSRSESVLFSSSSAAASWRVLDNSSAVAAHALMILWFEHSFLLTARMPELGEFGAEFGVCAFDCSDSASTANAVASSVCIVCQFFKFFILFLCYRFQFG